MSLGCALCIHTFYVYICIRYPVDGPLLLQASKQQEYFMYVVIYLCNSSEYKYICKASVIPHVSCYITTMQPQQKCGILTLVFDALSIHFICRTCMHIYMRTFMFIYAFIYTDDKQHSFGWNDLVTVCIDCKLIQLTLNILARKHISMQIMNGWLYWLLHFID